jgi:VIT1/CCC1 family predicted Fe2+/Mn2+ transporter
VPVLATEDVGPVDAIKRSVELLKRTWGEQIVGSAGIGAVFGLLTLGVFLVGVPLIVLAFMAQSVVAIVLAVALVVLAVLALGLIGSTLTGIYTAALYRYAAQGEIGGTFSPELVRSAFRAKA